jgi:amino acid transporter
MKNSKIILIARCFILLSFLIGTGVILLIYFTPTHSIVNFSVIYASIFFILALILFIILVSKAVIEKSSRRKFVTTTLLLLLSLSTTFVYYLIWNYALDTTLVKVINNTGQDVTEAGIYGCFEEKWGTLSKGESKTVRFPNNTDCAFMVTYKFNGNAKIEVLPMIEFTKNIYHLGTHPSYQLHK